VLKAKNPFYVKFDHQTSKNASKIMHPKDSVTAHDLPNESVVNDGYVEM